MKDYLILFLLCCSTFANAQCPTLLSLTKLQAIFKAEDKEDVLLGLGFQKYIDNSASQVFGRCRKVVNKNGNLECTNNNESFTIFPDGSFIYSTYDRTHYLSIKNFVKNAKNGYKNLGKSDIKGDMYSKSSRTYSFSVSIDQNECGSVNRFLIWIEPTN